MTGLDSWFARLHRGLNDCAQLHIIFLELETPKGYAGHVE